MGAAASWVAVLIGLLSAIVFGACSSDVDHGCLALAASCPSDYLFVAGEGAGEEDVCELRRPPICDPDDEERSRLLCVDCGPDGEDTCRFETTLGGYVENIPTGRVVSRRARQPSWSGERFTASTSVWLRRTRAAIRRLSGSPIERLPTGDCCAFLRTAGSISV